MNNATISTNDESPNRIINAIYEDNWKKYTIQKSLLEILPTGFSNKSL